MAMSPAKLHLLRASARAGVASSAGAPRPARDGAGASAYLLERARLGVDLRRLKDIQSQEKKIELKRTLLPEYDPWIAGVLDADAIGKGGAEDDIVTHIMIWRFDVGDFETALVLADYVLRHNLVLPERFNRTAATLIAEQTAEAAFAAFGQDKDFDLGVLRIADDLTDTADMPDQVRAKIEKALGRQLARIAARTDADADGVAGGKRAALEASLTHLKRALELDSNSGVKKESQAIEREIRKLVEAGQQVPAL